MARCERDKARLLVRLSEHVLNANSTQFLRLYQPHLNAALGQSHPWIHVGWVILEIDEDVIAFAKAQSARDKTQAQRGRSNERDFFHLRAEQGRRKLPSLANLRFRQNLFLIGSGAFARIGLDRVKHTPRQRTDTCMREENLFSGHRKLVVTQFFV